MFFRFVIIPNYVNHRYCVQVECILDVREMKRKRYFKVRWHGYGPNDDTWEPESNLKQNPNIAAMIKAYMEKVQDTKPQLPAKRARKSNEVCIFFANQFSSLLKNKRILLFQVLSRK